MKIFGLVGWSGAGKTTLIEGLLPVFTERGQRVSTLKHAHHNFDVDIPGKDSHRHRVAGATEVMVVSANRWAHIHELRGAPEPSLAALVARMTPVDLLLVEGFKHHTHPKLEIYRAAVGKPPLWPEDPDVVAVASDAPVTGLALPSFALRDCSAIADFILERAETSEWSASR